MGAAEVIVLDEIRARKHWDTLRHHLHARFAQWLDTLEACWSDLPATLPEVTATVWALRQQLTGGITEMIVAHVQRGEHDRTQMTCPQCERVLPAREHVSRTVETMVGSVQFARPYFYCRSCHTGFYPCDEAMGVVAERKQLDIQQAAVQVVTEVPYETAHTLFHTLTGLSLGSERMHTMTNRIAEEITVLDVLPSREEITRRVAEVARKRWRRPVLVLGIDGAYVPTRPESARAPGVGHGCVRAKRAQWRGQWREAKGFRLYLLDEERIIHLLSWHQGQTEEQLGEALQAVKNSGALPRDSVRVCVVADGAEWLWKHVQAVFPQARQVLDYYHCAQYVHKIATAQYGPTVQAQEWVEATMTRLYFGKVQAVLRGLRRMRPTSDDAAKAITNGWEYLHTHRGRTAYRHFRHGGYPLGSGGIESSNKFICHVRLKRSGAWWYEANSNQMLALRCAKYNGTLDRVFMRYRQRLQKTSE